MTKGVPTPKRNDARRNRAMVNRINQGRDYSDIVAEQARADADREKWGSEHAR